MRRKQARDLTPQEVADGLFIVMCRSTLKAVARAKTRWAKQYWEGIYQYLINNEDAVKHRIVTKQQLKRKLH